MDFEQWIDKLGLQQESFRINKKAKCAGIFLNYDLKENIWTLRYNEKKWDKFHLIHKLGFIWLYKKYKVLDFIKKENPYKSIEMIFFALYTTIMDAISYFTLANMDLDFTKEFLDFELKHLLRSYDQPIFQKYPLIIKLWLYCSNYIKCVKFPEFVKKDFPGIIKYYLTSRQIQIMEESKKSKYPLSQEIFVKLRRVLGKFDSIKDTSNYNDVIDYLIQICSVFPYWNKEYVIKQFCNLLS